MALAKKCDICGTFYDLYNHKNNKDKLNGFMFLNIDESGRYFSHNPVDCCPTCMESIQRYINSLCLKGEQ